MATQKWTKHKLTTSMLKQLAVAITRDDGSLHPGVGYGAPSSRAALIKRGMAEEIIIKVEEPHNQWAKPRPLYDTIITEEGRAALQEAREEGW